MTIEKSVQSLRDLEEVFVYIATDNMDIAVRFLESVETSLELLKTQPLIGSSRSFQDSRLNGVRMWPVKDFENYLIFYAVEDKKIKLLRVINANRDFNLIFDLT